MRRGRPLCTQARRAAEGMALWRLWVGPYTKGCSEQIDGDDERVARLCGVWAAGNGSPGEASCEWMARRDGAAEARETTMATATTAAVDDCLIVVEIRHFAHTTDAASARKWKPPETDGRPVQGNPGSASPTMAAAAVTYGALRTTGPLPCGRLGGLFRRMRCEIWRPMTRGGAEISRAATPVPSEQA